MRTATIEKLDGEYHVAMYLNEDQLSDPHSGAYHDNYEDAIKCKRMWVFHEKIVLRGELN